MNKQPLQELIENKRRWAKPLSIEAQQIGFKGWYHSCQLPHYDAPGRTQFITFRLADAMPLERRAEWKKLLDTEDEIERHDQIQEYLDRGYGACHLRRPEIADFIQQSLWDNDGVKYELSAWVIMPNHVHMLIKFGEVPMVDVLKSLKSFTARHANRILGQTGHSFWQPGFFDRYIRNENHFREIIHYIEANPVKSHDARTAAEWPWSSARFRGEPGPMVPVLTHPAGKQASQHPD